MDFYHGTCVGADGPKASLLSQVMNEYILVLFDHLHLHHIHHGCTPECLGKWSALRYGQLGQWIHELTF
jgi:hypothetical protein